MQWQDEIGLASFLTRPLTAVREDGEPTSTCGAAQAWLDQESILAIRQSAREAGRTVRLPLYRASQAV